MVEFIGPHFGSSCAISVNACVAGLKPNE